MAITFGELDGFQSMVPTSPSSPSTLSEAQTLWLHLRLAESETPRSQQSLLSQPFRWVWWPRAGFLTLSLEEGFSGAHPLT